MNKKIIIFLLLYYLFIISIVTKNSQDDLTLITSWASIFTGGGLHTAYTSQINYPPVSLYVINFFGDIMKFFSLDVLKNKFILKDMFFLFDIATFFIAFKICEKFQISYLKVGIILFNIALIYNSLFWGQVDSIYTFFAFLAIYLILIKKPLYSFVSLLFSMDSKPQAVLFIPIVGILLIGYILKDKSLLWKLILLGVISQLIVFWPFIYYHQMNNFFHMMVYQTTYFPKTSVNAYNFWVLIFGVSKSITTSDVKTYMGISYKLWGFILYSIAFIISFIPLCFQIKRWMKTNFNFQLKDWQIVFLTTGITYLSFFFFNTEMHERYAHPVIIFIAIFALLSEKYILYLLSSIAYLTNLTAITNLLTISFNSMLDPIMIAYIYIFVLLLGIGQLYMLSFRKMDVMLWKWKLSGILG